MISSNFYLTGNTEKYESGFIRIEEELKEYPQVSYEFKEIANAMQITFFKNSSEGINSLYDFIKNNPSLRVSQLEKKLNIPAKTIEQWIKQLKNQEKIEYIGSKKTGGYFAK